MDRRLAHLFTLVVAGLLWVPATALAGGFEYQAKGAPALGRGGAYAAGVDDPTALQFNPANLSIVGGMQLQGGVNLAMYNSCFARAGTYPTGMHGGEPYPEVCNNASPFPAPYLAFAFQPIEKLGIGVGIMPPAGISNVRYGRDDGTMMGPEGAEMPTPSRYLLMERDTPLFFPTIAASYEVLPWLRVGASFGWGIALTSFATTISGAGTEDPNLDVSSRASGADTFIPRVGGSVAMTPHDNLDIMLGFMWTQDIRANVDLEVDNEALDLSETVEGATLVTPQPWQLTFGIRYADRIRSREDAKQQARLDGDFVNDRMTNERWDIELNVTYLRTSNVDAVRVMMPLDDEGNRPVLLPPEELDDVVLPHNWRDQVVVNLGGDYNIIPGVFSVRSGLSFETNGVRRGYEQLSFRPGQRVGVHAGLTYRIANRVDVIVSYAHIFEQNVTLDSEEAQLEAQVGSENLSGGESFTTNAGTFRSNYNVVSLGLNAYF